MNKVLLIGRLAREPELRYTAGGTPVAHMVLAVSRPPAPSGEREADFFDLVVFGKAGEACVQYLVRGRQVGVEGRLHTRSYDDRAGVRRKAVEVVADRVDFLDRQRQDAVETVESVPDDAATGASLFEAAGG